MLLEPQRPSLALATSSSLHRPQTAAPKPKHISLQEGATTSHSCHPEQSRMRTFWVDKAMLQPLPTWAQETLIHHQCCYQMWGLASHSIKPQDKEMLPFPSPLILLIPTRTGLPKRANKKTRHAVMGELQISNVQMFSISTSCTIQGMYLGIVYPRFQFNWASHIFYRATPDKRKSSG